MQVKIVYLNKLGQTSEATDKNFKVIAEQIILDAFTKDIPPDVAKAHTITVVFEEESGECLGYLVHTDKGTLDIGPTETRKSYAYLKFMQVNPLCRGKGVGSRLISNVLVPCVPSLFDGIGVVLDDRSSEPFWRKNGFVQANETLDGKSSMWVLEFKHEPLRIRIAQPMVMLTIEYANGSSSDWMFQYATKKFIIRCPGGTYLPAPFPVFMFYEVLLHATLVMTDHRKPVRFSCFMPLDCSEKTLLKQPDAVQSTDSVERFKRSLLKHIEYIFGAGDGSGKCCHQCGKKATASDASLKRCGGCRIACYCSQACQKAAWKEHRKECNKNSEEKQRLELDALIDSLKGRNAVL